MDRDDLINGYLQGSLSKDQMDEFDRLLKTDASFAADFKFERELRDALKKQERQELKDMFSEMKKSGIKQGPKVIRLRTWLTAASIAVIVGLGSWLVFFNSSTADTQQLYSTNFHPYENVVHPIERGETLEDLKNKAFIAYEDGAYEEALDLFKRLEAEQQDPYIDFYTGIVQMQLNQHEAAIVSLEGYLGKNGQLQDRTLWYLALAHLKLGDIDKTKERLHELLEVGTFKKGAAQDLLEELE